MVLSNGFPKRPTAVRARAGTVGNVSAVPIGHGGPGPLPRGLLPELL